LHQEVIQTVGLDRMYPQGKPSRLHEKLIPLRDWVLDKLDAHFPEDEDENGLFVPLVTYVRAALSNFDDDTKASEDQKARRRLDMAVENFDKRLSIVLGKESAVIDVSFQHKDRDVAVQALDVLLKLYLEKRKQLYLDARGSLAKDEADSTHRRAAAAAAAVENFKRDHQIYSLPDQRFQLLQQRNAVVQEMRTVSNPALEDKLRDITAELDQFDGLERQFNVLEQNLQVANEEYSLYTHKLDEAQAYDTQERAQAGSVRVIQPPAAPPEPKRLQNTIIIAGFMLSLVFTALVAAITEFSRSGFLTPERLERNLGLPILGVLPLRK
jgi:uncharacterized protein involved in exopolysaccharide biosynthesis